MKLATTIRQLAQTEYVSPAIREGREEFSISIRELMEKAEQRGIATANRTPAFCAAIRTEGFLESNGLNITRQEGPASLKSSTVVIHYHVGGVTASIQPQAQETPEQRAYRLTEKLRGLMKDEIAAHGGAEGYLRWVRGEEEEAG